MPLVYEASVKKSPEQYVDDAWKQIMAKIENREKENTFSMM